MIVNSIQQPTPEDGTPYRIHLPYRPNAVVIQCVENGRTYTWGVPKNGRGEPYRYVFYETWSLLTEGERRQFETYRAASKTPWWLEWLPQRWRPAPTYWSAARIITPS